jgi:hypothetical protein
MLRIVRMPEVTLQHANYCSDDSEIRNLAINIAPRCVGLWRRHVCRTSGMNTLVKRPLGRPSREAGSWMEVRVVTMGGVWRKQCLTSEFSYSNVNLRAINDHYGVGVSEALLFLPKICTTYLRNYITRCVMHVGDRRVLSFSPIFPHIFESNFIAEPFLSSRAATQILTFCGPEISLPYLWEPFSGPYPVPHQTNP